MIQDPDFKASRGWIDRLMRDGVFTICMQTIVGQHLPPDVCSKVFDFIRYCAEQGRLNTRQVKHTAPCCNSQRG